MLVDDAGFVLRKLSFWLHLKVLGYFGYASHLQWIIFLCSHSFHNCHSDYLTFVLLFSFSSLVLLCLFDWLLNVKGLWQIQKHFTHLLKTIIKWLSKVRNYLLMCSRCSMDTSKKKEWMNGLVSKIVNKWSSNIKLWLMSEKWPS